MSSICPKCSYLLICEARHKDSVVECEDFKSKTQTNADRIRSMTDEEMATWFEELHDRNTCPEFGAWDCNPSCKKCWLDWLKKEATHGHSSRQPRKGPRD